MADRSLPTPEELRQLLRYDPEAGKLFWRERPVEMFYHCRNPEQRWRIWNTKHAGTQAICTPDRHGHLRGRIHGVMCGAGRVIWAITHGSWPEGEIDHINGVRDDNRLLNLRDVSRVENHHNRKRPASNKSGVAGVWWDRGYGRWLVTVGRRRLGYYRDFNEAVGVRRAALAAEGYHRNHGRP